MKLQVIPVTLREANDFISAFHRHSGRTARDGGRFAIGATDGSTMWGIAIVGRPLARLLNDGYTAEITRVCVMPNAPKGCCSFLYGRCWRIWQQMGGKRLVTYTLQHENGHSVRGAGWKIMGDVKSGSWSRDGRERTWHPINGQQKFRWEIGSNDHPAQ